MVTNVEVKLSPQCTEAGHTAVQQYRHHSLTPYMASERCEAVSRQSANIWQFPRQSHYSIQYKLCTELFELVVHTGDRHWELE